MNDYRHRLSGYFESPAEAGVAIERLVELGIPRERLFLMPDGTATRRSTLDREGRGAPNDRRTDDTGGGYLIAGHAVLLVDTFAPGETAIARVAMQGAVKDIRDVDLA